jgi:hypothetical protein
LREKRMAEVEVNTPLHSESLPPAAWPFRPWLMKYGVCDKDAPADPSRHFTQNVTL